MSRRTILQGALFTSLVLSWTSLTLSAQEQLARLDDGGEAAGTLIGKTAGEIQFLADDEPHSLDEIRRVQFPRQSPVTDFFQPARVFHLLGGGKVTGQLAGFNEEKITIQSRGKTSELPRRAVLAIERLQGERQLVYENFPPGELSSMGKAAGPVKSARLGDRSALKVLPGGSLKYRFRSPLTAGRCTLAFLEPPGNKKTPSCNLELQFQKGKTKLPVTIHLASPEGFYTVSHSKKLRLRVQKVRRESGWQAVTVLFDETRFQVLIGSHLLAFGRPPDAKLRSLRLSASRAESDNSSPEDPTAFWFDHVQITQHAEREDEGNRLSFDEQDQAVLANGDVIYGNVTGVDSSHIKLKGVFGEIALPWGRVRRIVFGQQNEGAPADPDGRQPLTGWHARITFQRFVNHPGQEGDKITAAVLAIEGDSLRLAHRWLGEFRVPFEDVDFIEPRFFGDSLWLSAQTAHLGNQVRLTFRRQKPRGSTWNGEFLLDEPPEGGDFLWLKVAELEPAGKDTPPASRFLPELRGGFLGTEVLINGQSLGRLNDLISKRASIESARTLRLRVPDGLLQAGKNSWRIEQTPSQHSPNEFDDCEIGPIRLEMGKSPVASGPAIGDD